MLLMLSGGSTYLANVNEKPKDFENYLTLRYGRDTSDSSSNPNLGFPIARYLGTW